MPGYSGPDRHFHEGEERWLAVPIRVASGYNATTPTGHNIVWQISKDDGSGSPLFGDRRRGVEL
jgi:hypothetical protein